MSGQTGFYGEYGGQYVPQALQAYLDELEHAFGHYDITAKLKDLLGDFAGRPSPLYYASGLSDRCGCRVYLKREDLNHTGAHKINNTLGQALLAKEMGKQEVIAETGAGQHGVATATACALLGLRCKIFMGEEDTVKQKMNVFRMRMLGAEVVTVTRGARTLKEAVDEAIEYLLENPDVFYCLGSVVGPHPYPAMVREFQRVIGREAHEQIRHKEGRLPDYCIACVGGGSNAIGLFADFLQDDTGLVAVEPAGRGLETGEHAASLLKGTPGVLHGFRSYVLQDTEGNAAPVHSIASGLDYPSVGPEHSMLKDEDRLTVVSVQDSEAIKAFHSLCSTEGIIPALESSHAVAYLLREDVRFAPEDVVILNLSGRGDKDLETVYEYA